MQHFFNIAFSIKTASKAHSARLDDWNRTPLKRLHAEALEAGRYEWEERLGHSLTAPFYYPDFCRTVCRKSYGLEIKDVGGEVGVFACKQFKRGNARTVSFKLLLFQ